MGRSLWTAGNNGAIGLRAVKTVWSCAT